MASEFILPIAVVILAGAGAFSAYLGWIRGTDPFDARKFANGVVTGVLAGIGLTLANAAGIVALDDQAAFIFIGSLALGVIGVDTVRTATSSAVANRAVEKVEEEIVVEEEEQPSTAAV